MVNRIQIELYLVVRIKRMANRVAIVCQAVILVTTVYSGVEYFVKNWDVFRES